MTGSAASPQHPSVAVIGAGIAGLTAANDLHRRGIPVTVFEAGSQIAGMSRTFHDDEGFSYDFGAHFITNRLAAALGVGAECRTVRRFGETVYLDGATYGFPFGLLRSPRFVASAALNVVRGGRSRPIESAAGWYRANYGPALADSVAIPLLEAWSGVPAEELAPSVIPPQVDRGTLHVLKLKIASRVTRRAVANGFSRVKPENPNIWHVYPLGGVASLCDRLAEPLEGRIRLDSPVQGIIVEDERVVAVEAKGERHAVSAVISTAPVHILPKLVKGSDSVSHLARFRYRGMVLVNLRFEGRPFLPDVTTWVPERRFPFFRLTEAPLAMPWLAPEGKTMVTADIGAQPGDDLWDMDDDALGELCVDHLETIVPGARHRYRGCRVLRTPVGYPIYLRDYEKQRQALERGLPIEGLVSVGRNGEFAHILMEDIYWLTLERTRQLRHRLDDLGLRQRGEETE